VKTLFGFTNASPASGGTFDRFSHVLPDASSPPSLKATFKGTKVTWYGVKSVTGGQADVYIDGAKKATVDMFGSTAYHAKLFTSATLSDSTHTIEIVAKGTKSSSSKDTNVFFDNFLVG
jgi:hypothetical protein